MAQHQGRRLIVALVLVLAAAVPPVHALRECRAKSVSFLNVFLSSSNCEHLVAASLDMRDVATTEAQELADVLAGNADVQIVDLFRAQLSRDAACAIGEALRRGSRVAELDLSHAAVGGGVEGLRCLLDGVAQSPYMRRLTLLGLDMGDAGADAFRDAVLRAAEVGKPSHLEALVLASNSIGASGPTALAPALSKLTHLRLLDLSNNPLGSHDFGVIARAIGAHLPLLETLLLQNTMLTSGAMLSLLGLFGPSPDISGTSRDSTPSPPISKLSLAKNSELGGQGVELLVQGLRKAQHLQFLDLSMVGAGDQGARACASLLASNPPLTRLLLSMNDISDKGGLALAHVLERSKQLLGLDLSYNKLTDTSGAELSKAIQTMHGSSHIEFLGLQRNNITDAVSQQITAQIKQAIDAAKDVELVDEEDTLSGGSLDVPADVKQDHAHAPHDGAQVAATKQETEGGERKQESSHTPPRTSGEGESSAVVEAGRRSVPVRDTHQAACSDSACLGGKQGSAGDVEHEKRKYAPPEHFLELEAELVLFLAKARLERLAPLLLRNGIVSLGDLRGLCKDRTPREALDHLGVAVSEAEFNRWQAALRSIAS